MSNEAGYTTPEGIKWILDKLTKGELNVTVSLSPNAHAYKITLSKQLPDGEMGHFAVSLTKLELTAHPVSALAHLAEDAMKSMDELAAQHQAPQAQTNLQNWQELDKWTIGKSISSSPIYNLKTAASNEASDIWHFKDHLPAPKQEYLTAAQLWGEEPIPEHLQPKAKPKKSGKSAAIEEHIDELAYEKFVAKTLKLEDMLSSLNEAAEKSMTGLSKDLFHNDPLLKCLEEKPKK